MQRVKPISYASPEKVGPVFCSICGLRAWGGIIDLWTETMTYLCCKHLEKEFDPLRFLQMVEIMEE